jgi:sialidase-1
MKRSIATSLSLLAAITLIGLSTATRAEELWVVKDGVLNKEALTSQPPGKGHVYCGGETVDGLFVSTPRAGGLKNLARFTTAKSAVGDCELKVVFSCAPGRPQWRNPNITVTDRARLYFWKTGSPILLSSKRMSLPLKDFKAPTKKTPFDGKLHSMAVKRVGDKISFYYDDKNFNEQPIDPDAILHLWFDASDTTIKIKSIKLTAEKLSDKVKTEFKSSGPITLLFDGTGKGKPFSKAEYGKACRYRLPAVTVSTKGTILAFAEARRLNGGDIGNVDAVLRRSEDNGKTWGPEILIWDDGDQSVNNPTPVVDPKTGRIWLFMGRIDLAARSNWDPRRFVGQFVSYSDDDGKTWSTPKDMTKVLRDQMKRDGRFLVLPGPGAGFIMQHAKCAGRLIVPMNYSFGHGWPPGIVYSDDNGTTWKPGGCLVGGPEMGEGQAAELLDGSLLFNCRSPSGARMMTILPDGGTGDSKKCWDAKDLPKSGCQASMVRHSWPSDGKPGLILFSGQGDVLGPGTLVGSYDDGKTWTWKQMFYEGPVVYRDLAVLGDGRVIALFEFPGNGTDGKSDLGFTILPAPPATPPAETAK